MWWWVVSTFSVSTVGLFPRRCLTCDLNKAHCTFFSADFSPTHQHLILHCKGIAPSHIDLGRTHTTLLDRCPFRTVLVYEYAKSYFMSDYFSPATSTEITIATQILKTQILKKVTEHSRAVQRHLEGTQI